MLCYYKLLLIYFVAFKLINKYMHIIKIAFTKAQYTSRTVYVGLITHK